MVGLLLSLSLITGAQAPLEAGAAQPPPRIELSDLAWLEGCWTGTGFGQRVDECWMRTPGGRLTGMFQLLDGERQKFSEIFVLDHFDDGPALRLKHFHANLHGWEEKDDYMRFVLRETGPGFARFDGLHYRLDEQGRLLVELAMKSGGKRWTESFVLERRD